MIYKKHIRKSIEHIELIVAKHNINTILSTIVSLIFMVYILLSNSNLTVIEDAGHIISNTTIVDTIVRPIIINPEETVKIDDTIEAVSMFKEIRKVSIENRVQQPSKPVMKSKSSEKTSKQIIFIENFSKLAIIEAEKYGIPASIKIAQGALESNWGEANLALVANNYFGIKNKLAVTPIERELIKGTVNHKTSEFKNNRKIKLTDKFCSYYSRWASIRHHSVFLRGRIDSQFNKGYAKMGTLSKKNYKAWARALEQAGYSTDPNYSEKIIRIIEKYKLYELD